MIIYKGMSNLGLVRKENQDYFISGFNQNKDFMAIVCDGVGGGNAGQLAATICCEFMIEKFEKTSQFDTPYNMKQWILETVQNCNNFIIEKAMTNKKFDGMATTMVGVIYSSIGTFLFNIGDCRIYGVFDKFVPLTKDHSYENYMREKGFDDTTIKNVAKQNMIANALGIFNVVKVDILKIKSNWNQLLLCSDGLHAYVSEKEIYQTMKKTMSPAEKCNELINKANAVGGYDNIAVFILERSKKYGKIN